MREKVEIPFREFEKPYYPRDIDGVNEALDSVKVDNTVLRKIAKKIADVVSGIELEKIEENPITQDGCRWRAALHFKVFYSKAMIGKVAILFPKQRNRSIAPYPDKATMIEAPVLKSAVDEILKELQKGLMALKQKREESQETNFIHHM